MIAQDSVAILAECKLCHRHRHLRGVSNVNSHTNSMKKELSPHFTDKESEALGSNLTRATLIAKRLQTQNQVPHSQVLDS
jgi:hypothetical protein